MRLGIGIEEKGELPDMCHLWLAQNSFQLVKRTIIFQDRRPTLGKSGHMDTVTQNGPKCHAVNTELETEWLDGRGGEEDPDARLNGLAVFPTSTWK